MNEEIEMPEDLGVKLGTKSQVLWERVKKQTQIDIENYENSLEIQKEILKLCERRIKEEEDSLRTQ